MYGVNNNYLNFSCFVNNEVSTLDCQYLAMDLYILKYKILIHNKNNSMVLFFKVHFCQSLI